MGDEINGPDPYTAAKVFSIHLGYTEQYMIIFTTVTVSNDHPIVIKCGTEIDKTKFACVRLCKDGYIVHMHKCALS